MICWLCRQPEYVQLYDMADHAASYHPSVRAAASTNEGSNRFSQEPVILVGDIKRRLGYEYGDPGTWNEVFYLLGDLQFYGLELWFNWDAPRSVQVLPCLLVPSSAKPSSTAKGIRFLARRRTSRIHDTALMNHGRES